MSAIDLDAAQFLADAATPGPWTATPPIKADDPFGNYWGVGTAVDGMLERFTADVAPHLNAENDARFAARARELVPALIARVRELESGLDPEKVEDQLVLESFEAKDGSIDVKIVTNGEDAERVMLAISDSMGEMLDTYEATNYVEFTVSKRGRPTFVTTIRRFGKPTPHELRQQAEAERDEWRARAEAAEAAMEVAQ
ncbi:hypothetical protein [Rhodococcus sp. IEGM 1330]|uniref:hypothetical protein n=1 Tax=Rhodococcus sp. IEGM 1330 TaxID=3082225 RepID=UPI0029533006|nr:hypothetical protein [Rhodococcus sp. IEGM 1330]MDV8022293.1 hypothetical protein [Rhodococcus sp. IEGM 1330]